MKSLEEFRGEIEAKSREKIRKNKRTHIAIISICMAVIICAGGVIAFVPGVARALGKRPTFTYSRADGTDLMASIKPHALSISTSPDQNAAELTDFGLRLFKAAYRDGENTLISPLSVISALGMVSNGAKGETLEQLEKVFGMNVETLNRFLQSYMKALPQARKYRLTVANSIWFANDGRLEVDPDFLQTNADYYGADAYAEPFDDTTVRNINDWVNKNTDGMIEKILDQIDEYDVMHLINAITFDAKWEKPYESYQLRDRKFTAENGSTSDILMMYSNESIYYSGEGFQGFAKPYKDSKYAFVALLPDEGHSISELLEALDGNTLYITLSSAEKNALVKAGVPKFEIRNNRELNNVLSEMGMEDVFDSAKADLSGIGRSQAGNLFISSITHSTYISVNENGTKASAVTVGTPTASDPPDTKTVILDRPFLYMLIDCQTNTPFFIGTVMDLSQ